MKTIRQLRRDHGWTQFELALQLGVQPQAVYFWESGRRTPRVPQLRKLGQLFGICSDEIALELVKEAPTATLHRARADRYRGEPVPGRSHDGRAVRRGRDAEITSRNEP